MLLLHQLGRKSLWLLSLSRQHISYSDEDEILPTTLTSLLQIPPDTHYSIRAAVLRLLSQLGGWIKEHHEMLGMVLCLYASVCVCVRHT